MGDLGRYIANYYPHLLTKEETLAQRSMIGEAKVQNADMPVMKEHLRRMWISEDPQIHELLADGPDAFFDRLEARVMRDHPDEVFINLCPRCQALAKTPTAKQCHKCFFSWHDEQ